MKITFYIHTINSDSDRATIDSINSCFCCTDVKTEVLKQKDGEDFNQLVKKAAGDYICFMESGCLLYGTWRMSDLKENIYKLSGAISGRAVSNIDSVYNSIENHSTYLFKKTAVSGLSLKSNILFWQIKEAALALINGRATIAIIKDVYGDFSTFAGEKANQLEDQEVIIKFINDVIFPMAEKCGRDGFFMWQEKIIINYFVTLTGLVLKAGDDDTLRRRAFELLHLIDEDAIVQYPKFNASEKVFWLKMKKSSRLKRLVENGDIVYYHDSKYLSSEGNLPVTLQFIDVTKDYVELEGSVAYLDIENRPEIYVLVNALKDGEEVELEIKLDELSRDISLMWGDKIVTPRIGFLSRVSLEGLNDVRISFFVKTCGMSIAKTNLRFNKYTPLYNDSDAVYSARAGWVLRPDNLHAAIFLTKESPLVLKAHRRSFEAELKAENFKDALKTIFNYRIVEFMKKHGKKRIWLVSDRINRGDDNGEAFFKFLSENKSKLKNVKPYFVLQKDCPDAARLKKYGRLIEPMSMKHKLMHLRSEYVISSQGNDPVVNPFKGKQKYYRPLLQDSKFVFLQHGITKDNQSAWLNKYNRNIYGLIVSTKPEYDSMFEYEYLYSPDRIWLTGMPRFDLLHHDEKKYVTVMPTWRKSLMSGSDPVTSIWLKGDKFDDSKYVRFYDELLNNEKLIDFCKSKGYTLCFMPHPNIAPYVSDSIRKHKDVIFFDQDMTYRDIFAQTDLMITDYSSVAFDFAYLRKPIIYCHFDRDDFFNGSHSYTEGYFDYERDGFGKVCLDLNDTIDEIKKTIDNSCVLEDCYRERIDKTFAFADKLSSQRVLDKLLEK